jgi:hypothetical protein
MGIYIYIYIHMEFPPIITIYVEFWHPNPGDFFMFFRQVGGWNIWGLYPSTARWLVLVSPSKMAL